MTPTRTRADNFVRHQIERFRGDDTAWALYCKRRKGVREMIDKLEAEMLEAIEETQRGEEIDINEKLFDTPEMPPFIYAGPRLVLPKQEEFLQRVAKGEIILPGLRPHCISPIVHSEESGFDHMPLMTDAEMYPEGMPNNSETST